MFYGASRWGSGVEVPANDRDFYALKDVPHGHLQQILYPSKTARMPFCAASFTPHRAMRRTGQRDIRFCICNTAAGRRNRLGRAGVHWSDHGQPDRRRQGQALHRRDGQ